MLIAHLSDPHVTTGALGAEPVAGLHRALGRALGLQIRPDCVVITGDLTDHGTPADYAVLREILERFPIPLHLVVGNHDKVDAFLDAFADTRFVGDVGGVTGVPEASYAIDYPGATIVVLDSKRPGTPGGHLGADQLAWLDVTLGGRPDVPAIVCLHHPPMALGIPFLDGMRLDDGDDLAAVIVRHRNVVRVLAGHDHRTITAGFAGTVLTVAPSTYRQSELALNASSTMGYVAEPTGFLLHRLQDGQCVTHVVSVSHAGGLLGGY
jgi:3',5'-cyclic AMP phosphodiesterase CpdA